MTVDKAPAYPLPLRRYGCREPGSLRRPTRWRYRVLALGCVVAIVLCTARSEPVPSTSVMAATSAPVASAEAIDEAVEAGVVDWIADGVASAISAFFESLVSAALEPLLKLLGESLLSTPSPSSIPQVGELWEQSWQITLAGYSLLVMVAGVLLMAHGSVQSRYSLRELAPRIPLGFLAAGLSLFIAGKAVDLANALSLALVGGGLDEESASTALQQYFLRNFDPGTSIFYILVWVVAVCLLVALLVTYVVRIALTILMIVGAPLALMCHALPLTDGVARWWWRVFAGLLAIQVAQSMALIVAIRVFLTPGGFSVFGSVRNSLVNVLVVLALTYILFKIPFWILHSVRLGQGRSFVGRVARGMVMYKTFGLLRGVSRTARVGRSGAGPSAVGPNAPSGRGSPPGGMPPRRRAGSPPSAGRAITGPRRSPRPPLFLPPQHPGSPTQASSATARQAAGAPPMPLFLAPNQPAGAPPVPAARPTRTPGQPVFRSPGGGPGPASRPVPRPTRAPGVPRFQGPVPQQRPVPPLRTSRPPAPTTFRAPVPSGDRPPRRIPPPPQGGSGRRGGDHQ